MTNAMDRVYPDCARFRDPGTPLTREQRDLRARILKEAENEPRSLHMGTWETVLDYGPGNFCGTARCIAGWSDFFSAGRVNFDKIAWRATGQLGLTQREHSGEKPGEGIIFYVSNAAALERLRRLVHSPHEEIKEEC